MLVLELISTKVDFKVHNIKMSKAKKHNNFVLDQMHQITTLYFGR